MAEPLLAAPTPGGRPESFVVTFADGSTVVVVAASYDEEGDDYVFRDGQDAEVARHPADRVVGVAAS